MTDLAAGTLGPTAYWYMTRATGFVSLVLLTAVIVLGVMGPLRVSAGPRWPRFALDSLHRDLSLLAVALIGAHVLTTVLDGFAPISLLDAVIPFNSPYRPLWLGLGAVAFDLMLALVATSLVRRRLGYRAWRAIHWLAYASWPVAVLHSLGTGSDSKRPWGLLVTFLCVIAVSVAAAARVRRAEGIGRTPRQGGLVATVLTPVALIVFTLLGPLAPHWAERAGTPGRLLFSLRPAALARASSTARVSTGRLALPFTAQLDGVLRQSTVAGGEVLDMELRVSGGADGVLRIRLAGQPLGADGLSMVGSQVDLVAAGLPAALQGRVTALQGTRVVARVSGTPEPALQLVADLQIDQPTGRVTGTLQGRVA